MSAEIKQRLEASALHDGLSRTRLEARPAEERRLDFGEVYLGLTAEEAQAEAARCLRCGICSECLQCVYACRAEAIDHNQVEEIVELKVGAVVLTPGLEPVPGDIRPEYGYGRYPNVVTSLEFERMLSASGPFSGVVQRPSDSAHPQKIAWIQCVGSRDSSCGQGYCSSVCCMYATKEAVIAREHDPSDRADHLLHGYPCLWERVRCLYRPGGERTGHPLPALHGLGGEGSARGRITCG